MVSRQEVAECSESKELNFRWKGVCESEIAGKYIQRRELQVQPADEPP